MIELLGFSLFQTVRGLETVDGVAVDLQSIMVKIHLTFIEP